MAKRTKSRTTRPAPRARSAPDPEPLLELDGAGVVEVARLLRALLEANPPPEVRRVLTSGATPAQMLQALGELDVFSNMENPFVPLIEDWKPTLDPGRTALDAELAAAEMLSSMRSALGERGLEDSLPGLIETAEVTATPEGLAMLRTLAVMAPPGLRDLASSAADRMVSAGLTDPPWTTHVGRPQVVECFGYADDSQESVTITFRYGRKRHGVVVLIDYHLGGGVKDCWVTDKPGTLRRKTEAMDEPDLIFQEYDPDEAYEILAEALSEPPCPVQLDQVEDVQLYLGLLRSRVELLAPPDEPAPSPPAAAMSLPQAGGLPR